MAHFGPSMKNVIENNTIKIYGNRLSTNESLSEYNLTDPPFFLFFILYKANRVIRPEIPVIRPITENI